MTEPHALPNELDLSQAAASAIQQTLLAQSRARPGPRWMRMPRTWGI